MKEEKTFTGLYFGVLPNFKDLLGCLIEEEDEGQSVIQPLGCRELLFTEPRLLLSPCLECGNQAFIVCKKSVLKCPKFQSLLKKLKFKIVSEIDVNKELIRYCLAFTLTQKLAPLWNKVGEYFVQGRDFLENVSKLNAVTLDVSIMEDKLCVALKAFNVKMRLSQAEDFCSSSNIVQQFLMEKEATVDECHIQDCLCFVLPSLKKGRIIGISHQIPSDCPFSCYEDLRKHWKLMYGYRLPSNESTFYNVKFFCSKSKTFTYPSSCIRSALPQVSPRCDQQAIFQAFLQDLQNRSPVICESFLKLTSSPLYCSNRLNSATNGSQSSLTRTAPILKHCTPFVESSIKQNRPMPETASNNGSTTIGNATEQLARVSNGILTSSNATTHTPSSIQHSQPSMQGTASNNCTTTNGSTTTGLTRVSNGILSSSYNISNFNKPGAPRFVPSFTKTAAQSKQSKPGVKSTPKAVCNTIRPVFKSKASSSGNTSASSFNKAVDHTQLNPSLLSLPRQLPTQVRSASVVPARQPKSLVQEAQHSKKLLPEVRPGLVLIRSDQMRGVDAPSSTGLIKNPTSGKVDSERQLIGNTFSNISRTQSLPSSFSNRTSTICIPCINGRLEVQDVDEASSSRMPKGLMKASTSNQDVLGSPAKRQKGALEGNTAPMKKPRLKPKIQEDIDVRQFALTNQLNKVNSSTLIDWLKKRKVAVKQKDKKPELMEKVMNFIQSTAPL